MLFVWLNPPRPFKICNIGMLQAGNNGKHQDRKQIERNEGTHIMPAQR